MEIPYILRKPILSVTVTKEKLPSARESQLVLEIGDIRFALDPKITFFDPTFGGCICNLSNGLAHSDLCAGMRTVIANNVPGAHATQPTIGVILYMLSFLESVLPASGVTIAPIANNRPNDSQVRPSMQDKGLDAPLLTDTDVASLLDYKRTVLLAKSLRSGNSYVCACKYCDAMRELYQKLTGSPMQNEDAIASVEKTLRVLSLL